MKDEEEKHLREIIKLRGHAISVALKLQAKVYEVRLRGIEKNLAENQAQIARVLWTAGGVSLSASVLVTGLGLWLVWRK